MNNKKPCNNISCPIIEKPIPKATIAILVVVMFWCVYTIFDLFSAKAEFNTFKNVGARYTPDMAKNDNIQLKNEILETISKNYPQQWLRDEINLLSRRIEIVERQLEEQQQ